jgi:hypothetical protein
MADSYFSSLTETKKTVVPLYTDQQQAPPRPAYSTEQQRPVVPQPGTRTPPLSTMERPLSNGFGSTASPTGKFSLMDMFFKLDLLFISL